MSTKRAQFTLSLTASEEFTAAEAPGAGTVSERTLKVGAGNNLSQQLTESSTPAITAAPISLEITIGGAATTLDLTAITGGVLPPSATRTIDLTGKKLVGYNLRAADDNADPITIGVGAAADPYPIFGAGRDKDIEPGEQAAGCFRGVASSKPAVAAGVKEIEIDGTAADVLYLDLYFGT